jgi:hypothetical protein
MDLETMILTSNGFKKAKYITLHDTIMQPNQSLLCIKKITKKYANVYKHFKTRVIVAEGTRVQYGNELVVVQEHPFFENQNIVQDFIYFDFEVPGLVISSDLSIFLI